MGYRGYACGVAYVPRPVVVKIIFFVAFAFAFQEVAAYVVQRMGCGGGISGSPPRSSNRRPVPSASRRRSGRGCCPVCPGSSRYQAPVGQYLRIRSTFPRTKRRRAARRRRGRCLSCPFWRRRLKSHAGCTICSSVS